jgi:hypothetical protein
MKGFIMTEKVIKTETLEETIDTQTIPGHSKKG